MVTLDLYDLLESITERDVENTWVQLALHMGALSHAVYDHIMEKKESSDEWLAHAFDYPYLLAQIHKGILPVSFALKAILGYAILKARDPELPLSIGKMSSHYGTMFYLATVGGDFYTPSVELTQYNDKGILSKCGDIGDEMMRGDLFHSTNYSSSIDNLKGYYNDNLSPTIDQALERGSNFIFIVLSNPEALKKNTHRGLISAIANSKYRNGINIILKAHPTSNC